MSDLIYVVVIHKNQPGILMSSLAHFFTAKNQSIDKIKRDYFNLFSTAGDEKFYTFDTYEKAEIFISKLLNKEIHNHGRKN